MVDVSKATDHSPTLTDHEVRIRILERDYAEIKEIREDVKTLQVDVGSLKSSITELPEQLRSHFKYELRSELGAHEINEARNQSRILWAILGLALTIIGSAAYLITEQVVEKTAEQITEHRQ